MFTPPSDRITTRNVNFMATCLCDSLFSDAAKNAVEVLRYFGAEVNFPSDQTCCGQPAFNSGDFESARKVLRKTIEVFSTNDDPIVVPSASCAAMLYHSSKIAFRDATSEEKMIVDAFAKRVWEFCDYIYNVLDVKTIAGSFNGKLAVHNSCHSIGSGTPEAMLALLKSINGAEIINFENADTCCGFGGTFSVVFPEISSEMGLEKVKAISAVNPDYIVAADTSCLLHQRGIAVKNSINYPVKHVSEIFAEAMRNGGLI